jgi:hypothetical protein
MATSSDLPRTTVRAVIQQCISARLQVKPPADDADDTKYVEIGKGIVIYVCFLKGADSDVIRKAGLN